MKKIALALLALFLTTTVHAGLQDEESFLLTRKMNGIGLKTDLGGQIQRGTVQVAEGIYDFTKNGAGYTYDIDLGESIPKNSIIKNAYYKVISAVTTAGTASGVKISVGTSTVAVNDIVNPIALTSLPAVGFYKQGALFGDLGGASTFRTSGVSTVKLRMRVTGAQLTGGKIVFVVEYVNAPF